MFRCSRFLALAAASAFAVACSGDATRSTESLVGPTGPQGPLGGIGPAGLAGATGGVGATGTVGVVGATGANGLPGIIWRGVWRSAPAYTTNDAVEYDGSSYIALRSVAANGVAPNQDAAEWEILAQGGVNGGTGPAGVAGPTGIEGAPGLTGPQGSTGPAGATGLQGPAGATGLAGLQGVPGQIGPAGVTGPAGPAGAAGATGAAGVGLPGQTGAPGGIGPTGPAGPAGPTGGGATFNGTTDYVVKFSSPTTVGDSEIYDTGSFVGIGTTTATGGLPEAMEIDQPSASGTALLLQNTANAGSSFGSALLGVSAQQGNGTTTTATVIGIATASDGVGMAAIGNDVPEGYTPTNGSGGAFTGKYWGVYGYAYGSGSGSAGVYAVNDLGDFDAYLGYYSNATGSRVTYDDARTREQAENAAAQDDHGVGYAAVGNGSFATSVPDATDPTGKGRVTLHATESPEVFFQDFGEAQLVRGAAHITLDPLFAGAVQIDSDHPMHVFLQVIDDEDSPGLVVKNRTAHGFDVVERQHGTSTLTFQWQVICNRADEKLKSGLVSHNADLRFESFKAPGSPAQLATGGVLQKAQ